MSAVTDAIAAARETLALTNAQGWPFAPVSVVYPRVPDAMIGDRDDYATIDAAFVANDLPALPMVTEPINDAALLDADPNMPAAEYQALVDARYPDMGAE